MKFIQDTVAGFFSDISFFFEMNHEKCFVRKRLFTLENILCSLFLDAALRFECGTKRLLGFLLKNGYFPARCSCPPSSQSYHKACAKLPVEAVKECVHLSQSCARTSKDELYHGMRVLLADGTKIIVPRNQSTIAKYGLNSGSVGDAYYPQIHAGVVLDLATGAFSDMNIDHGKCSERAMLVEHANNNVDSSLYVCDAGYNGLAHMYLIKQTGHNILMQLKSCKLSNNFRASKKRSAIVTVKLTKNHFKSYPDAQHHIGETIQVRLIRTIGTSKLRSKILITTLLDEEKYTWLDLSKLYLQRWTIELALRYLKSRLNIEHIQKILLRRIQQLIYAAVVYFNLSTIIRNVVSSPQLFPRKKNVKVYCFSFVLQLTESFIRAALKKWRGRIASMEKMLKAIKNCWFRYDPWRIRPKICQFPPSVFTRRKTTQRAKEFDKADALSDDMKALATAYDQTA
jgi:hypothetical protein